MKKQYNKSGQEIRVGRENPDEYMSLLEILGGFIVLGLGLVCTYLILLLGSIYSV
tara:strand:+ start:182 stop:346 length:165 start_codon:yes stop_codon:yes gene_type:complete